MADKFGLSLEAMGIHLPYSVEAEQAVLGAVITNSKVLDSFAGKLMPEHFYVKNNADIYREMQLLSTAGMPVDFVTVLDAVVRVGAFESEEDAKIYLFNITQTVPTIENAATYADIIFDKYISRSLILAAREIIDRSGDGMEDSSTLLNYAEQQIYELRNGRNTSEMKPIEAGVMEALDRLNKLSGPDRSKYLGMKTGFQHLDHVTSGLNRSDLIILAARPSVGKTSFALNIASNVAKAYDVNIAIFSLEMTARQLAERLLSDESGIDSMKIRTGEIQPSEWVAIAEASDRLSRTGIFLDDTSGISVNEIKAKCRRIRNLGLVIIDYLQLMGGGGRKESRVQEISEITRQFKIMAKELDVPVLLLSQLSRSNEKAARRPMLSDLRDSGSIEQDADIVLFLHRDKQGEDEEDLELSEILLMVAKNRHGERTNIDLRWDGKHTRFSSTEYRYDD